MVRTGEGGVRITGGKSSKKSGGGVSKSSTPSKKSSGGKAKLNPIVHRETPTWQKPITNFFTPGAGSSKTETNAEQNDKEINENDDEKNTENSEK